jgi:hypothetical protein
MGLTHRELGLNAAARVTVALIEGFSKLTCPPDREIFRAVDRDETETGNTRPCESYAKRS